MSKLKGYKTLLLNGIAFIYILLPILGIEVPVPEEEVIAAVLTVANIVLRFATNTSVGKSE